MSDSNTRREKLLLATFTRNRKWNDIRKRYLKQFPECAACGGKKQLVVHHKKPFQWYPELELDMDNLITLCKNHHLTFGHLDSFLSYNENVIEDVERFREEVRNRPKWRRV